MSNRQGSDGGKVRPARTAARARLGRATHLTGVPAAAAEDGEHNMTYARIVEQVTDAGLTQKELGVAVGASLRTVQNWAQGGAAPRGMSQHRLLELKYIVEELLVVYTDEAVEIWFRARNRALGGHSPMELMSEGNFDDVRAEAQRLAGGM